MGRLKLSVLAVFCGCSLLGIHGNARAEFSVKNWKYYRQVDTAGLEAGKNYRLAIDGQVYDASRVTLDDLRLLSDEAEVPYEITRIIERSQTKNTVSAVIENSVSADKSNVIIADLGQNKQTNNKATLEITGRNFGKRVSVEGSDDKSNWAVLANDAYIYDFSFGADAPAAGQAKWSRMVDNKYMVDFSYNTQSRDTAVAYPQNNFRYIRITLRGIKEEEPLSVAGVKILSTYVSGAEEEEYSCSIKENKVYPAEKTSQVILDFGYRNLPVQRLKIECEGMNYYRTIYVQGSNDLADWNSLGSSEIFDYNVENFKNSKKEIAFSESRCRYIKLTILNQDNLPIKVTSARGYGLKRYLIFPWQKSGTLKLYYGNPQAPRPVYDYSRFIGRLDFARLAEVKMGRQQNNPAYAPDKVKRPWTEEHPYLIWAFLVGVVLVLLALAASMMKKVK